MVHFTEMTKQSSSLYVTLCIEAVSQININKVRVY